MSKIINTKRARIQIIHIEDKTPPQNLKRIFRNIKDLKAQLATMIALKEKKVNIEFLRRDIQHQRSLYKIKDSELQKKYTFSIFVHKYQKEVQIALHYTPGAWGKKKKEETNPHPLAQFKDFLNEAVNEAMRVLRRDLKPRISMQRYGAAYIEKFGNKKVGTVNVQEMSVLKMHVQKNIKNLYDGKTPTTPKKYIGVELEFCAPIKEELFALKLFQHGIHKYAQLKQDGSLRPNKELKEYGFELAILLEETSYKKGLKKITNLLREVKAVARDRRCGLHIHLDMRRRNKDLVYNNLVACQYALLSIVDPSRYNNEFCQIVKNRKIPTKFTGDRHERYKTINAAAYYKFKTLEVRMHEGSVSFDEITHWIDMLIKIANYTKKLKDDVTELDIMQRRFKFKSKLYTYALERSCSWQLQNNTQTQHMREDIENLQHAVDRNRIRPIDERGTTPYENARINMDNTEPVAIINNEAPTATGMFGRLNEVLERREEIRNRIAMPAFDWAEPVTLARDTAVTFATTETFDPGYDLVDFGTDLDDNETEDETP